VVQIYRKKWERQFFKSVWGYFRDWLVLSLPFKRLPRGLRRTLYGEDIHFAFLVHPRSYQDVFISAPFLKPIQFLFRKSRAFRFLYGLNPFVLNRVRTRQGLNGIVVGQFTVPEMMFRHRKQTLEVLRKSLKLVSKISCPGAVAGLGGWLPMVSKRGESLSGTAASLHLRVTNGHCGTLASIYMMVEKIAGIGGIPLSDLRLGIIGAGKMGGNVAKAFYGRTERLVLIDILGGNLSKIKRELEARGGTTRIETVLSDPSNPFALKKVLAECHLGICATSSLRNLLKLKDMPDGFVAIDDSRPEALPRDPRHEKLILEGGLLKIRGAEIDYDYGFGQDDNVFGCLGEAFLLALSKDGGLKPTLGDVDLHNFFKMLEFCKINEVEAGDFKSSDTYVTENEIRSAMERRGFAVLS